MKRVREPSEAMVEAAAQAICAVGFPARTSPQRVADAEYVIHAALSAADLVDAREAEAELRAVEDTLAQSAEDAAAISRLVGADTQAGVLADRTVIRCDRAVAALAALSQQPREDEDDAR